MRPHWSFCAGCTLLALALSGLADLPSKSREDEGKAAPAPKSASMLEKPAAPVSNASKAEEEPTPANTTFLRSMRVRVKYDVRNVGPSGVSAVELWYTQDGKTWEKASRVTDLTEPLIFRAQAEGRYGFAVVVQNGAGVMSQLPKAGDKPQSWVEVDDTPPSVELYQPVAGQGPEKGKVILMWSAKDKNLAPRPITLSYAEEAHGPWHVIADNVENTGRYAWEVPKNSSYRYFLRIEAADRANNLAAATTKEPIALDFTEPEGVIVGVEAERASR